MTSPDLFDCTACGPNYDLYVDGTCVTEIVNCQTYNSMDSTKCDACADGYAPSSDYTTCDDCNTLLSLPTGRCAVCSATPSTQAYAVSCTTCGSWFILNGDTCELSTPDNCAFIDRYFFGIEADTTSAFSALWSAFVPTNTNQAQCCRCDPGYILWPDLNICASSCEYANGRLFIDDLNLCIPRDGDQTDYTDWYTDRHEQLDNDCYPVSDSFDALFF